MRRRLSAVLLAAGLAVSAFSMGVYAEETETEVAEQVTEAAAEAESEVAEEAETETASMSMEEQLAAMTESYLSQLAVMTDEQLQAMVDSGDAGNAALAANWMSVKSDLGNFTGLESYEVTMTDDSMVLAGIVDYDGVDEKTDVEVTLTYNFSDYSVSMEWNIVYPFSTLMQQAALNTVMGLGIVFLALFFLSWLIGKLHYIPDMIEARAKKNAPAQTPAPAAPAPAAAPAAEEEELVDDCELVAVIAAAIAAAENTSTDGFVVRSIRKANKKNWQRA